MKGKAGRPSEALTAERFFTELGLAPDRVIIETKSRNTVENARFSRASVEPAIGRTWLLVTSAFHMPRAIATFKHAGWKNIVPYPFDYRSRTFSEGIGWDLAGHLAVLNIAIKEYVGLFAYRLVGYAGG